MIGKFVTIPEAIDNRKAAFVFLEEKEGAQPISCQTHGLLNAAQRLSELRKLKRMELDGYWIQAFQHPPMVFCVESIRGLGALEPVGAM